MTRILCIAMLFSCLSVGCSSYPPVLTPKIAQVLIDAHLDISVNKVSAYTYWSSSYGHGLEVEVKATRTSGEYARNLDLELSDAAKVCAALSKSKFAENWDFIKVAFFNNYGRISPASRDVGGVAVVIVKRETFLMLSEKEAPPEEYPKHWVFILGYKDQPDSKKGLEW